MTRAAHFQRVLEEYQARRRLPSLVAGVLESGRLVWTGTAGQPAGPDVQFRVGSITKTLTAILVLQCRDDDLLDLDDPIGRHLPAAGYARATVRQLLSHTSGMQSEPAGPWWERSAGVDPAQLLAANDGSGRVAEASAYFHYSNLGFALLGELVARLRGETWRRLVTERICRPLELNRTSYLPQEPYARGWSVHELRGTLDAEPATDTVAMAPAGQLWSTVADLGRFGSFLAQGDARVLGRRSWGELAGRVAPAPAYGLGTMVFDSPAGELVGHLGTMPGFQASLLVSREHGGGVVALTNATTGIAGLELTHLLLGETTPPPIRPWTPSESVPAWAEELLGWWFWGNSCYELRWENEQLELRDLARGMVVTERFDRLGGRILGQEGYHRGETLEVHRRADGSIAYLECATFVFTSTPYDEQAPIPGR